MGSFRLLPMLVCACVSGYASWDVGKDLNANIAEHSNRKAQLIFEFRTRLEYRPGQSFGIEPDLFADFTRFRFGLSVKPASWIRLVGVAMDARAPLYGTPAPSSARDPIDLHEAYIEIRPEQKLGFGATLGRQTANYGDTRLVGSPQWAYIPRTYDGARVFWRWSRLRLEALVLSPVRLTSAGWNKPVMGERLEGTYNTLSLHKHATLELYALRKYQNRAGGFNGVGRLIVNSFGAHLYGPIANGYRYNIEVIGQTGDIGPLPHRANAWAVQIGKNTSVAGKSLDLMSEYKYASGDSRSDRSGTFDQLYPAAHDKLGHADVLGWRNNRNLKGLAVLSWSKSIAVNLMYNNTWLADRRDAVYNLQGRPLARSISGTAGSHVGQEADLFVGYKRSGFTIGAGYGYFFPGEFIRRTTHGVSPQYAYVYQGYSF
jgi:hypothetical protein